jgi:hypothetical protein
MLNIDQVLADNPEYIDQLRPELEAALWLYQHRDAAELRPGYLTASRNRLIGQIKGEENTPIIATKSIKVWSESRLLLAFLTLFVVFLVFGYRVGTPAIRNSLPGDQIYQVKRGVEEIQLSWASVSSGEAALRIELADRRAEEVENLLIEGRYEDTAMGLQDYSMNISIASELILDKQDDPHQEVALAQKLTDTILEHESIFSALAKPHEIPDDVAEMLLSTFSLNEEVSNAMVTIMEEIGEESRPIPSSVAPTISLAPPSSMPPTQTQQPERSRSLDPDETPAHDDPIDDQDSEDENKAKPTRKPTKTPKIKTNEAKSKGKGKGNGKGGD